LKSDKLKLSSNTIKTISDNANLLKDMLFKSVFTEPKIAINFVQKLIPF